MADWDRFWADARAADLLEVAQRLFGARLKKIATNEYAGACPSCGGDDRFSINTRKGLFNCRGVGGGDVIKMVEHAKGCSPAEAAERILGRPRPNGARNETPEERDARPTKDDQRLSDSQKREEKERAAEAARAERKARKVEKLHTLGVEAADAPHAMAYFAGRGMTPHRRLLKGLRYVEAIDYYGQGSGNSAEAPVRLATTAAIIADIRDENGQVIGQHVTYLDPNKPEKFKPPPPNKSARKIQGDVNGGMICLGRVGATLAIAEGVENALSWHQLGRGPEDVTLATSVSLQNLKAIRPREGVEAVIIAADNDSEPVTLLQVYRAAIEWLVQREIPLKDISFDWPPPGSDWNNVLLFETKGTQLPEDIKATDATRKFRHPGGTEGAEQFLERVAFLFEPPKVAVGAWPKRKPIVAELKPVPAFDADALLPDALRAWVMDEAGRMPCPPDYIAAPVVVGLSSIVGAHCAIKPKAHDLWLIVPNLWGGNVGDPGAKKSPGCAAALSPMGPLIAKAHEEYAAALQDYDAEKAIFGAQSEGMQDRIRTAARNPDKGVVPATAREFKAFRDQAPQKPTLRRYKTNDSTGEKLGELLGENPAGILVERDELVGLLATWDRQGREGERAFFLEAWNGNQSFDVDRIGRGHIRIPNVCVSIFGSIQPDKLIMYLEQAAHSLANDGMLQRFQVMVYPDPWRWEYRDRAPNRAARDAAFAIFKQLSESDPAAWGAAPAGDRFKFPHFSFGAEAQRVYIEWAENLHQVRMLEEDDPIIRQHLSKYDKLFPALALIFHLVDCAARGVGGPVTKEAALCAAAWCEYLEAHARRCYGLLKDEGLRAAQALVKKLERGALADGFTARDVRQHDWRNLTTDEAVQAALDWLEDDGWIRGEATGGTGPGSGRRTIRYRIHPELAGNAHNGDV